MEIVVWTADYVVQVLNSTQEYLHDADRKENSLGFVVVIIDSLTPDFMTTIGSDCASLFDFCA